MNNRIMATLFALAIALFIGVVPVEAEAASNTCRHKDATLIAEKVATPATCTEDGIKVDHYYCNNCGTRATDLKFTKQLTEAEAVIPNLGHDYEWVKDKDGHKEDCTRCDRVKNEAAHTFTTYTDNTKGKHTSTCDDCGYKLTADHYDDNDTCVCDAPGCEAELEHVLAEEWDGGSENHWKNCTVCGEQVGKTAHTAVWVKTDETHKGECSECGYLFYGETAHEFEYEDNEDGTHTVSCAKCDMEEYVEACVDGDTANCSCYYCDADIEHTYDAWSTDATTHWKNCTVCGEPNTGAKHTFEIAYNGDGTHSKKCTVCEYAVDSVACWDGDEVDCKCQTCGGLIEHEIGPLSTVKKKNAKCLEDGYEKHYKCNTCNNIFNYDGKTCTLTSAEEVKIPATGHVKTEVVHYEEYHVERCKKCEVEVGAQVKHSFTYVINGDGTHTATCSGCTRSITARHEDSDTDNDCVCDAGCGHVMTHVRSDLTYHAHKKATCLKDGHVAYFTCNTCGEVLRESTTNAGTYVPYTKETKLEALGHDWVFNGKANGLHWASCQRTGCTVTDNLPHTDTDNDCLCDLDNCGELIHSHKRIFVDEVAPSCGQAGTEGYYKYEACGKMFDLYGNAISAPVEIAALTHVAGDNYEAIDGDKHAIKCENCGEAMEDQAHADSNNDNRCDVCTVELTLVEMPEVPATCTGIGYAKCWKSPVTDRMYADPYGNEYITSREVIPAKGHTYTTSNGSQHVCGVCGQSENHTESEERPCFCEECNLPIGTNHTITAVAEVAATCTKPGTAAYVKCSCGTMYDAMGNVITAPKSIPATGHIMDKTLINDNADHYVKCTTCGYEAHEEHAMAVSDPLKGNYHQWLCECGEVETAIHADKNGDNKCDDCDHDMSGTAQTVEQHDNKTVVTGDPDTIQPTKNWFQNWLENLLPGNSGGTTSSKPSASESTNNSGTASGSGNSTTTTPESGNTNTPSGNSGTTNSGNAGGTTESGSASESTGIINEFIQWLSQLFGAWLQGK